MPRRPRKATGGIVYHVLNRAAGKLKLFEQDDDYAAFERVLEEAYMERNALQANLVERAQDWRWSSIWRRCQRDRTLTAMLSDWPVPRPRDWTRRVNRPLTEKERDSVRKSIRRGRPFGDEPWTKAMARQLSLESTLRPRGRPRKPKREGDQTA